MMNLEEDIPTVLDKELEKAARQRQYWVATKKRVEWDDRDGRNEGVERTVLVTLPEME